MSWIVLGGYMGAGKSAVGRRLSSRLSLSFVDADREVEAHAGMAIPEIFAKRGELWFRRTEEDVIREILGREPAGIVALGGGALESAKTRSLISRTARLTWLRVSPEVAWERVSGSNRPLATDRDRFIRRAIEREPNYREVAAFSVDADASVEDIVLRVSDWVRRGEG